MLGDPDLARTLQAKLRVPVLAGPMFIASTPALVIAQSQGGIVGSMPALNARSTAELDENIAEIREALGDDGPYAINLVAHRSNSRLDADYAVLEKHKVPIVVLALAASKELVDAIHGYGAVAYNDIVSDRHARKCAEIGVDGIIAVAAGAGGHTGNISPFALISEIREWWEGPLALSGAIATGRQVLAAQAMGADFGYIGSSFLASTEANTAPAFKQMIVDGSAKDLMLTNCFTGVNASFLRPSILANGLDPKNLVRAEGTEISIEDGGANSKAWRDIWSAGQGIGAIKRSGPASDYITQLIAEYDAAKQEFAAQIG
ncbi:nitronate monooxygenase family protein [soil metagenome]